MLLPGMMCDARLFAPQIAAFSGSRAVQVAPLSHHARIEDLAAEVLAHAPPRFALAGLSMGGIVAMEMLRQAPARISRLALLDTNPLAERAEVAARRPAQMDKARVGQLRAVMRDEMKPNYLTDGPHRGAILETCMAMAVALGPEVFLRQSRALMDRPDQQETLRACKVPALALCGRDDVLCPVERHVLMAELIPDCALEIIAGAGHLPTLEQPEMTNAALERWLAREARRGP